MRQRSPATTWPRLAPALAQRLTMGPHATERQTGEEEETAVQLVAGDSSGESSGATAVTSPARIQWCPQLKLLLRLKAMATTMATHGHGMASFGEVTASRP